MDVPSQAVIYYDGERLTVPTGRTLLAALESAGMRLIRGVGCRGGVCGACTVLYRIRGEAAIKAALLCQDMVQDGMEILPLPYVPQKRANHEPVSDADASPAYQVNNLYPEVNHCIMCRECTRICPMHLDVMEYVGMVKRGDLRGAARESFTCIQCLACVMRCPSQISQPNAALAARRFHGREEMPRAEHLTKMLVRMQASDFQHAFDRLSRRNLDELRLLYQRREREPDEAPPGTWLPEDRQFL